MPSGGEPAAPIIGRSLVKGDKQNAAILERPRAQYTWHPACEPAISLCGAAVMHIRTEIRGNPDEIWYLTDGQLVRQRSKRHNISASTWISPDVVEIHKWIMLLCIGIPISHKARPWHTLHVGAPGVVAGDQLVNQVG